MTDGRDALVDAVDRYTEDRLQIADSLSALLPTESLAQQALGGEHHEARTPYGLETTPSGEAHGTLEPAVRAHPALGRHTVRDDDLFGGRRLVRGRRELASTPLAPGAHIDAEAARVLAAVLPVVTGLATRHRLPEGIRCHRSRMPFQGRRVVLRFRGLRHDRRQQLARFLHSGGSFSFSEITRSHHGTDERPHPRTGQVHAVLDEEFRTPVRQGMPIDQYRVRILRHERREQAVVGGHPAPRDAGVHHQDAFPVAEHVEHGAQLPLGDIAVGTEVDQHLRLQFAGGADTLQYLEDVRRLPPDGGIYRGAVDTAFEGAARAERDGIPHHCQLAGIPAHQRWRWPGRARDACRVHGGRLLCS